MSGDIERIREALQFIDASDRETWLRMGMAIKSELGDTGFDVWEAWSLQAESFNTKDTRDVWKSMRANGKVTIGTLFYEAKANRWRDDGGHPMPTPEELAERRRIAVERTAQEEAELARERADTAKKAAATLKAATEVKADLPYLSRKRVSPVATLREIDASAAAAILGYAPNCRGDALAGRLLVVPVKQGDGLSTLELIDGDKRKAALAGRGSKVGGYWATERLPDGDGAGLTLLIGEGVATVLSSKEATGHPAIAALSSGNLPAVAKAMRERYPAATLVILADLVKATGKPNPHAIEAARVGAGKTAVPDFGSDRDPDMTDMNDLSILGGVEAVAQAIANASAPDGAEVQTDEGNAPAGDAEGVAWPDPQPLAAKVEQEPYPLDALPDTIRAAVEEVAGFVKAPLPMLASSALAALSLAIQAHVDVGRDEILFGPISLFILTIADSGERKTQADKMFTKPLLDYHDAQAEAAKPKLREYRAALEAWEAKRSGIKDQIRQLAKSSKPTAGMESALGALEHQKPEAPRVPKLIREDATPEGLAKKLQNEWPSAGVVSNEAGIVFGAHGMGKESVMRNLALLNKLWDGGRYQSDRGDDERSRDVRGARLTMGLMIQEPTLRAFFEQSKGLARGTGFLARFLVAWPDSTMGARLYTPPVAGSPALSAFNRRITTLLDLDVPIDQDGALTPQTLALSPAAKAAWVEYHDAVEVELRAGGELHDVKDVASKSADNAARLAAQFHVFEHGIGAVGLEAFQSASLVAAWHLNESRRFFGELALPAELADAVRLDTWLMEYCRRESTCMVGKNRVRQYGPLRDAARLDAAIKELADLDRARLTKTGKKITVQVNPALAGVAP